MTGMTVKRKTLFDAIIAEPLQLAIDQPPQLLISAASVFLVAAEGGKLLDPPFNWALAIGAEWAYLRGLTSGQSANTKWAARLIWSAVILVITYGSLWALRQFGVQLPGEGYSADTGWSLVGSALVTIIHIGCISAVTLCSAMCHRASLIADQQRHEQLTKEEDDRRLRLQADADALEIDRKRKEQELALWQKAQEVKRALKVAPAKQPASERPPCPSCGLEMNGTDYALYKSCQARSARFRGCKTCRDRDK